MARSSVAPRRPHRYDETIRLMSGPRFRGDLLITDRIGLDDLIGKGYDALLNEKDKHVKILVKSQ